LKKVKVRFEKWTYPDIKEGIPNKYQWMVQNIEGFELGANTDIGAFTYINAKFGVIIERDVQIGSHCSVYSISTIDNKQGKVTLRENVKIGSHTTILPGVTVGKNSIIGAHSLVTKNIPDNTLAYGTPAKVIRTFNE